MDLIIESKNHAEPFLANFAKSRIIGEVVNDIIITSGLDLVLFDSLGNKILDPRIVLKRSDIILKDLHEMIKLHILKGDERKTCKIKLQDPSPYWFVVSSLYSQELKQHIGYMVGGPFTPEGTDTDDNKTETQLYFDDRLNGRTIKKLTPTMQNIVVNLFDSYSRLFVHLYEEKLRSNRNLSKIRALYQINTSLNATLDLKKVLQLVIDTTISLLEAENGSIMLLDEARKEMKIFVANNLNPEIIEKTSIRVGEGIAGWVAKEGKSRLLLKGVRDYISTSGYHDKDLKSGMSVPLIARDEVIGVINISGKKEQDNFSTEDLELLKVLAANAAVAIDNARIYNKLQRKVLEMAALFDIGKTVVSTLDSHIVMNIVLDNAIHLLNAKYGSLMLVNEHDRVLEIVSAHGLSDDIVQRTKIQIGEGIAGKVAQEGKPRLLKKGIKEEDSKSETRAQIIQSALSVPLKYQDKIIGVLNIKEKINQENFDMADQELLTMLASLAAIAIENAKLHKSLRNLFVNSIKALSNAIDARDPYTRGHSERVTEYAVRICEKMNFPQEEVDRIRYAALLHDIGKINIKEEILNKPGKLSDEEFQIIAKHPTYGAKIMEPVEEFRDSLPYLYHHHEKYEAGGGYPGGIHREEIPLPARIIAVADAFDAMTSDRPYRKRLPLDVAVSELMRNSGTQFDPIIVEVFLDILQSEKEWVEKIMESFNNM